MPELGRIAIDALRPAEYNPRTISEEALAGLRKSIERFGLVEPIVFNRTTRNVVGGHQRLKVLRALGVSVVDVVLVELPEKEEKALNLALNSPEIAGEWDREKLNAILEEIEKDLPEFFSDLRLGELVDTRSWGIEGGETDQDAVPTPPDAAVSARGEIYALGYHRLMCGDSANVGDLDRLLDGAPVHLVNTDPPYNVRVEPRSNNAIAAGLSSFKGTTHHQKLDLSRHPEKAKPTGKMRPKDRPLENDFISKGAFDELLRAWFGNIERVLDPGRAFYIWGGYSNVFDYPPALETAGLKFSQIVVWVKGHPVMSRKDFMGNHESAFYGWKPGKTHYFNPEIHNATDVWEVKKITPTAMIHLTEKPVELATRAMEYSSKRGENVLDLFGGAVRR